MAMIPAISWGSWDGCIDVAAHGHGLCLGILARVMWRVPLCACF